MSVKIIEDRLQQYTPETKQAELNALKEITQEITLAALSRSGFFKVAAFQGETCLRILHGLQRFSEDLDFVLFEQNNSFMWDSYLNEIKHEFAVYGLMVEVSDRSKASGNIKKAFLKDDSFGQVLNLQYSRNKSDKQSIRIKLEIDTHPPLGSTYESKFVDFPSPFSVIAQDLSSLFASKLHALLCRPYEKGRDWYDFIWYVSHQAPINLKLLNEALIQYGPWHDQVLKIDASWVAEMLTSKVNETDWKKAGGDVMKFIQPREHSSIELWGSDLFLHYIERMRQYLGE